MHKVNGVLKSVRYASYKICKMHMFHCLVCIANAIAQGDKQLILRCDSFGVANY